MEKFDAEAVRKEVQGLIMDVLNRKKVKIVPEDIKEGVSLTTQLGIDSLDILQVSATVEKKYRIKIPEDELQKLDDVGAILKAVQKHWPK